jgi:hypothetical protein
MKMYIAVLDSVPDFMTPTLVAHSVLAAHTHFLTANKLEDIMDHGPYKFPDYIDWFENHFRKVVVRVNEKEFVKICQIPDVYLGHENTTLGGEKCCAIPPPCDNDNRENVLKFAKMWKPDTTALEKELAAWKKLYTQSDEPDVVYENGEMIYVY